MHYGIKYAANSALSVVIITYQEAHNIECCIKAVQSWVSEIIVVDSGSDDGTVEIAQKLGAHVIKTDWPGYGAQKQRGLDASSQPWILSIDADEVVSPLLGLEIQQTLKTQNPLDGYELYFESYFLGQHIRYGDWRAEYHLRLFKRTRAHFSLRKVHCKVEIEGPVGRLKHPISHFSYPDCETIMKKLNLYSSLAALQKYHEGKKGGVRKGLFHGIWSFIRGYIFRLGFLDGAAGLKLAIYNAEGSYYRYIKLHELNSKSKSTTN